MPPNIPLVPIYYQEEAAKLNWNQCKQLAGTLLGARCPLSTGDGCLARTVSVKYPVRLCSCLIASASARFGQLWNLVLTHLNLFILPERIMALLMASGRTSQYPTLNTRCIHAR